MCIMYEDLVKKHIIIEFSNLIKDTKTKDKETDSYVKFMKEVILNTCGVN